MPVTTPNKRSELANKIELTNFELITNSGNINYLT